METTPVLVQTQPQTQHQTQRISSIIYRKDFKTLTPSPRKPAPPTRSASRDALVLEVLTSELISFVPNCCRCQRSPSPEFFFSFHVLLRIARRLSDTRTFFPDCQKKSSSPLLMLSLRRPPERYPKTVSFLCKGAQFFFFSP